MTGSGSGDPSDDPDQRGGDRSDGSPADESGRGEATTGESGRRPEESVGVGRRDQDVADGDAERDHGHAAGSSDGVDRDGRPAGDGRRSAPPAPTRAPRDRVSVEDDGIVRWFLGTDEGAVVLLRDLATSVGAVVLIGLLLFAVSGVWPPLVAVESGSMEPNMAKGDLVYVVDEQRFVGDGSIDGTGVVTYAEGAESGHAKFGEPGDVIIFYPNGDERQTPVIHRAYYWVEEGDDWIELYGDEGRTNGNTCDDVPTCPARHDGFVTMGDANQGYDQVNAGADTDVVRPEWITGKAMFRIPWLGYVRLTFDRILFVDPVPATAASGLGGALVATGAIAAAVVRRY